jgi:hypothetical protein
MTKRLIPALACLTLAALACQTAAPQGPATLQPTPIVIPSPLPPAGGQGAPTIPPAPTAIPTSPPPFSVWPLPADLFYLNDAGQVWRQPNQGDETTAVQVSRPGDVVADFTVAPGGQWLLDRVAGTISVVALSGGSGQVIAQDVGALPDMAHGHTLAWSADAARIAYVTGSGFQIYIPGGSSTLEPLIFAIPVADSPVIDLGWSPDSRWLIARRADGGTLLADTDDPKTLRVSDMGKTNGFTWLSDSRLLFAPVEGGLAVVAPGQLDTRTFLVGQAQAVDLPVQRADGTLAFFIHNGGISQPGILTIGQNDHSGFQPASGVAIPTAGLIWALDGTHLIGQANGAATRLVDPVTGAEGKISAQGNPISFAWGEPPPRGVTSLPLPANLYFLAPQNAITQVWRLPGSGDPPEPVTSAAADVTAYDISADGSQITYSSGGWIYLASLGNPAGALQIIQLAADAHAPTGTPSFSPTGKRIAFASNGIWVYDIAAKEPRRLVVDIAPPKYPDSKTQIFDSPRWSPDGQWLLLRVRYFQGQDHALIPSGGGFDPLAFRQFNAQAKWEADGAVYVFSDGTSFGQPSLTRLAPARPPIIKKLLDVPVIDVQTRPDGRLAILRSPSPFPFGPTSTRIFSMQPDGSDLRAETPSLVLDQPILSPDAVLVAGLALVQRGVGGFVAGELVIVNPATKQMFVLEGMPTVHDLLWGK